MARFVTRRLITMVALLFVISLVTFLLFIVALPGGNPAAMIAGRLATPGRGAPDQRQIRLRQADLGPVRQDDGQHLRPARHTPTRRASTCCSEIRHGLPATLSLALGAGLLLAARLDRARDARGGPLGQVHRPRADRAVDGRRLDAAVLPRRRADLLRRLQGGHHPAAGLRGHQPPVAVVPPPRRALVHALGPVHRLLFARTAQLDPRHDGRGLRAHRARQGAV